VLKGDAGNTHKDVPRPCAAEIVLFPAARLPGTGGLLLTERREPRLAPPLQ